VRAVETSRSIQVPAEVEMNLDGRKITVKGPKGTIVHDFSYVPISIELREKNLRIWAEWPRKKEASLVGTIHSHIQNMIEGVTKGYTYKLKIVFSHFPISVKTKDNLVLIENFTGERSPRKAKIIGNAQVKIEAEDIIVQGTNLEDVSQTAANIEQATKVKRKDPRVFLDGIFVYEKTEGAKHD
jgi:large subunit ribosomal protein L6